MLRAAPLDFDYCCSSSRRIPESRYTEPDLDSRIVPGLPIEYETSTTSGRYDLPGSRSGSATLVFDAGARAPRPLLSASPSVVLLLSVALEVPAATRLVLDIGLPPERWSTLFC